MRVSVDIHVVHNSDISCDAFGMVELVVMGIMALWVWPATCGLAEEPSVDFGMMELVVMGLMGLWAWPETRGRAAAPGACCSPSLGRF